MLCIACFRVPSRAQLQQHLLDQDGVVFLLKVAVGGVAQDDIVQEPLQVALQSVLGTMHKLLSQPALPNTFVIVTP